MADLPDTICFKAQRWLTKAIDSLAEKERRTRAAMARVLIERQIELEKEKDGSV